MKPNRKGLCSEITFAGSTGYCTRKATYVHERREYCTAHALKAAGLRRIKAEG